MKRFPLLGLTLHCLLGSGCAATSTEDRPATDRQGATSAYEAAGEAVRELDDDEVQTGPGVHGNGTYGHRYGLRPEYEACMSHQPGGVSAAGHRQDCAEQELEFQDSRLNRAYERSLVALDDEVEASMDLRSSQQHWLSRLDGTCGDFAAAAGSAMGPAAQSTCVMELTAIRAEELERAYSRTRK